MRWRARACLSLQQPTPPPGYAKRKGAHSPGDRLSSHHRCRTNSRLIFLYTKASRWIKPLLVAGPAGTSSRCSPSPHNCHPEPGQRYHFPDPALSHREREPYPNAYAHRRGGTICLPAERLWGRWETCLAHSIFAAYVGEDKSAERPSIRAGVARRQRTPSHPGFSAGGVHGIIDNFACTMRQSIDPSEEKKMPPLTCRSWHALS